jgi:hypothetical protein
MVDVVKKWLITWVVVGVAIVDAQVQTNLADGVFYHIDPINGQVAPLEKQTLTIKAMPAKTGTKKGAPPARAGASFSVQGSTSPIRLFAAQQIEFAVGMSQGLDPAMFVLRQLTVRNSTREFESNGPKIEIQVSPFGSKYTKITPTKPLSPGEYAIHTTSPREAFLFGVDPGSPPISQIPPSDRGITKEDVVRLVKAGIPDSVIIARIEASSGGGFNLSADDLLSLQREGMSKDVMLAMITGRKPKSGSGPGTVEDTSPQVSAAPGAPSTSPPSATLVSLAGRWQGKIQDPQGGGTVEFTLFGGGPAYAGSASVGVAGRNVPGKIRLNQSGANVTGSLTFSQKAGRTTCETTITIEATVDGETLKGSTLESLTCVPQTQTGTIEMKKVS